MGQKNLPFNLLFVQITLAIGLSKSRGRFYFDYTAGVGAGVSVPGIAGSVGAPGIGAGSAPGSGVTGGIPGVGSGIPGIAGSAGVVGSGIPAGGIPPGIPVGAGVVAGSATGAVPGVFIGSI